jgi:prophage antirepressor-like protein
MTATYDFRGHPVRRLVYADKPAFIGREVGAALGYEDGGKRFVSQLTREWKDEIKEGTHWFRVKGPALREIKAQAKGGTGSVPPSSEAGGEGGLAPVLPSPVPREGGSVAVPPQPLDITFANEILLLTEEGLNLALMRSGRPIAVEFRAWLATEVVPEIVRTGRYDPAPEHARAPRLSPEMAALKLLVGAAICARRLDVAADLIETVRRLGPGETLRVDPRLRASNRRLLAALPPARSAGVSGLLGQLVQQPAWLPTEKAVLALLLDLTHGGERLVEGRSHKALAGLLAPARVSVRSVGRALAILERAGVIACLRPTSAGAARAANGYRLDLEAFAGWTGKGRPAAWGERSQAAARVPMDVPGDGS